VLGVAAVASVASYEHAYDLVRAHGEAGWTARLVPLEVFADQLAADRVPSVRAIRAQLHVGQPRAQRLRDYLAGGVRRTESLAA
jgi:hypothetical protein